MHYYTTRFFVLLAVCVTAYSSALCVHTQGKICEPVRKIFALLGCDTYDLAEANTFAQMHLLRTGERWDVQEETSVRARYRVYEHDLRDALREVGMCETVYPERTGYDYIVFMGATTETVRQRFAWLEYLLASGYTGKTLVLLGGKRVLSEREREGLPPHAVTETDMVCACIQDYPLCAQLPRIVIDAPLIQKHDGSYTRPTTDSTLECFLTYAVPGSSCMVISNQPFCARQTCVAQRILEPYGMYVDGTGSALSDVGLCELAILMDEFARLVYEQYIRYANTRMCDNTPCISTMQ